MTSAVALGSFIFEPGTGRLTRDGLIVALGGCAISELTVLAGRDGTVTKDELLAAVWPGVAVEEGNLAVQIASLRKVLGEDIIVTVPRVGYRLRPSQTLPATAGLPRIAVLPCARPRY